MDESQRGFLIAEYSALRREIELKLSSLRDLARYAIVSSGAIWVWLLSVRDIRVSHLASFIPLILTALLFGETLALRRSIRRLGRYILRLETHVALPDHLGWETQLERGRQGLDDLRRPHARSTWL